MPLFSYTAKNLDKGMVEGEVDALNQQSAVHKILAMGHTPIVVEPTKQHQKKVLAVEQKKLWVSTQVSDQALAAFSRSLGDLLDAGIPLVQAMSLLSKQRISPVLKDIIINIGAAVKDGASLSRALEAYPWIFNRLYVSMVRASEAAGNVARALTLLSQNIEKDILMQRRVRSALMYPMIILGVGVAAIVVLLTFVLPKLTVMFDDFGADLPWPTKVVVGLSAFLSQWGWVLILAAVIGIFYVEKYRRTVRGHEFFSKLVLDIPILSDFLKLVHIARYTRTLAVLLESGVPMTQALESSAMVLENAVFLVQAKSVAQQVRMGASLSIALNTAQVFGDITSNLISVGEQGGKLEHNLYKIAAMHEDQSQQMTDDLLNVLGPAVLILVVMLVGSMMLAIILPLIKMNMIIK